MVTKIKLAVLNLIKSKDTIPPLKFPDKAIAMAVTGSQGSQTGYAL